VVAQFEAAVETDAGSGLASRHVGVDRVNEGEQEEQVARIRNHVQDIEQHRELVTSRSRGFSKTPVCQTAC